MKHVTPPTRRVENHLGRASATAIHILETLRVQKRAQALLIAELAEEAVKNKAPRSERHRFCHDLVLAANRRFYFFGDVVAEGTFREDLLYRMNVLTLRVPPLRERPEDMKSIAAHVTAELDKAGFTLRLSKKEWDAIRAFEWPGNVRQFLNVLKRAAYLEQPVSELLAQERQANHTSDLYGMRELLALYCPEQREDVAPAEEVYRAYVRHVLGLFEGNMTQTAKALGVATNAESRGDVTPYNANETSHNGKEFRN